MSYKHDYNEQNMWEGQIIVYEDNWFEGVVIDPASTYTKDRFVFGVYFPGKGIELLKLTPGKVSNPFVFRGKKNNKGYNGTFNVIGQCWEEELGVNQISLKDSELQDTEELQSRINCWKKSMVDVQNIYLYECIVQMRFKIIKVLRAQYEGRELTTDEVDKILKDWEPMNEKVFNQTKEAIKKLVKKVEKDNDDLRF